MANEIKEHEDYNFVDGVAPEGIVSPSADARIEKAESKYGLVIFGARRARQINAYYANLQDNTAAHVGPLVDAESNLASGRCSATTRSAMISRIATDRDFSFDEDGYPVPEDLSAVIDFSAAEFSGAIEEEYIPAGSEEVIAIEEVILDESAE